MHENNFINKKFNIFKLTDFPNFGMSHIFFVTHSLNPFWQILSLGLDDRKNYVCYNVAIWQFANFVHLEKSLKNSPNVHEPLFRRS